MTLLTFYLAFYIVALSMSCSLDFLSTVVLLDLTWRYIFSHLFDEKMEPINIFVKRRLFDISERSATFGKALQLCQV